MTETVESSLVLIGPNRSDGGGRDVGQADWKSAIQQAGGLRYGACWRGLAWRWGRRGWGDTIYPF